jgi:hypothetical protein
VVCGVIALKYYERSYGDGVSVDLDKEIALYRQVGNQPIITGRQ